MVIVVNGAGQYIAEEVEVSAAPVHHETVMLAYLLSGTLVAAASELCLRPA